MSHYDCYYVEPSEADSHVPDPKRFVWYFRPGESGPPRCLDLASRPADAVAAVLALTVGTSYRGTKMWTINSPDKDPIPPQPPPAWPDDLDEYMKRTDVQAFVNGGAVARSADA